MSALTYRKNITNAVLRQPPNRPAFITVSSQTADKTVRPGQQEAVYIKGLGLADALSEKWISEYSKEHPDVALLIAGKNAGKHSILEILQGISAITNSAFGI